MSDMVDPLITELLKLGFKKDYASRAGGQSCKIYIKDVDQRRRVQVQLWGNGGHRAGDWQGNAPHG